MPDTSEHDFSRRLGGLAGGSTIGVEGEPARAGPAAPAEDSPRFDEVRSAAMDSGLQPMAAPAALTPSYWGEKAADFQTALFALDEGWRATQMLAGNPAVAAASPALAAFLYQWLDDFESKKRAARVTSQAINAGASAAGVAGQMLPALKLPASIGLAGAEVPTAAAAAFGVAGSLMVWAKSALHGLSFAINETVGLLPVDSPAIGPLVTASQSVGDAARRIESTGFSDIAPFVKWGALALGAWLLWQRFGGVLSGSSYADTAES